MALTLYDLAGRDDRRFSPFCWRTKMALAHKRLDFTTEPVGFTEKHKIAFSGQGRVPVIKDGDNVVFDSWTIACYLEDRYPQRPLLFGNERVRNLSRFLNRWTDSVQIALVPNFIKDIHDHARPEDQAYFRESREKFFGSTLEELQAGRSPEQIKRWAASLDPLRAVLADSPYLCGASPAYGDYIVFGMFQWVRSISPYPLIEKNDPIYDWRKRMLDLFGGLGHKTVAYKV